MLSLGHHLQEKSHCLTFVGHSLGRLVIKKVVISNDLKLSLNYSFAGSNYSSQEAHYNDILTSTCGEMFMGVPHDGSDHVAFARRHVNIAKNGDSSKHDISRRIRARFVSSSRHLQVFFGNLEGFSITTVIESDKTLIPGTTQHILVCILPRVSYSSPLTDFENSTRYISKAKPWSERTCIQHRML